MQCSQSESYGIATWGDCRICAVDCTVSRSERKYQEQNVSIIKWWLSNFIGHALRENPGMWDILWENPGLLPRELHNLSKIQNTITTRKRCHQNRPRQRWLIQLATILSYFIHLTECTLLGTPQFYLVGALGHLMMIQVHGLYRGMQVGILHKQWPCAMMGVAALPLHNRIHFMEKNNPP